LFLFLQPGNCSIDQPGKGRGSIAVEPIRAGEMVVAFGGTCLTRAEFDLLSDDRISRSIQIDDELFLSGHVEA
jgi:hypothetical protein